VRCLVVENVFLTKWRRVRLWHGLRRWRSETLVRRRAVTFARAAARLLGKRRLAEAWRVWLGRCAEKTARERALRSLSAVASRKVAVAFCEWRFAATQVYAFERAVRVRQLRTAVRAAAARKKVEAWRTWRLAVRAAAALGTVVARREQRELSSVFEAWLIETRLAFMNEDRLCRLLEHWCRVRLFAGWSRWRLQDRQRVEDVHFKLPPLRRICFARGKAVRAFAFRKWLAKVAAAKTLAQDLKRALRHLTTADRSRAFQKWRALTAESRWRRVARALEIVNVWRWRYGKLKEAFEALARHRIQRLERDRTVAMTLVSTCEAALKAAAARSLSRGFRRWHASFTATTFARAAIQQRAVPTLRRLAHRSALRQAFATWEAATVTSTCRELAARTILDVLRGVAELKPLSRAFAAWRLETTNRARADNYDLALALAARPAALRHAAFAGVLGRFFTQFRFLRRALHVWRRAVRHALGARVLALTLGAAAEALVSGAFDHWSGATERRKEARLHLLRSIHRRLLYRTWRHWCDHVEVQRELASLQAGVRALVRAAGGS